MHIVGQLSGASNVAIVGIVDGLWVIYKPIRGEQPLWDFPTGTLAGREYAAYLVAMATGYAAVPPTVVREGPLGVGTVQLWIGSPLDSPDTASSDLSSPVALAPVGEVPSGWLHVVDGHLPDGAEVSVLHEDRDDMRDVAVLDAITNQADRKGSHLVRDGAGRLWGFDHGLTFNTEPKLRTVLWGWAGKALRQRDLDVLTVLESRLTDEADDLTRDLREVLPSADVAALLGRVADLLRTGRHPRPSRHWPSIPWPAI